MRILSLLLMTLLLAGCVPQWVRVDTKDTAYQGKGYRIQLPAGWVRIESDDTLVVTRDGPGLQKLMVRVRPNDKAFKQLEKGADPKQLPSELAELYLAEMRKEDEDEIPSLEIVANEPARIAGHDAFRVHVRYRTGDGLRYDLIAYGFVTETHFYSIIYTAPTLHFFEQDKGQLDAAVASFRLS
jgi:hypothetical protein